jgi:hypothetical protein
MRLNRAFLTLAALAALTATSELHGQQGHPLDGTWYGDWGPSETHRNPIVLVIEYDSEYDSEYDGDALGGLINPGPDSIPLDVVRLDTTDWSVHMEATATNPAGQRVDYTIEGQIENLGLPNRSLRGTWQHGNETGTFLVTRN